MPLYKGTTEITGGKLYKGTTEIMNVYKGSTLVFQSTYSADFLVVGGGGAGVRSNQSPAGGGGAGGYRTSYSGGSGVSGGNSSLEAPITLEPGVTYTATIGLGATYYPGGKGSNSSFIGGTVNITSLGGGAGINSDADGGSGGGTRQTSGSTSPQGLGTSGQGSNGGRASGPYYTASALGGGGGGGAGGVGSNYASNGAYSAAGGAGLYNTITGSQVGYAGGANGHTTGISVGATQSAFGVRSDGDAVANTGSAGTGPDGTGRSGSGVVIIRIPTANYSGTTTGSPTVTTDGTDTIIKFTGTGTYTA